MTNLLSIWLAAIVLLGLMIDAVFLGGFSTMFLARRLFVFVDWLAFWR